ncbi:MAG: 7,8-Dihydro-6-hydroxymethylpterin-pyrophosphokinase [Rhodocyclaceae bacterium]|nr:7,8-Dihydro-6-hydroxymethylpterin-pyrophosphokinase [Rhodocyclaceae bacterium]
MKSAYIALGANLGDPAATVRAALEALAGLEGVRLVQASSLYRTAPVGLAGQPDFINAVAHIETSQAPQELLETLLGLENCFGRVRLERNGPRTLDLDLLLYEDLVLDSPALILPHPRLHLRAFVLAPLAEIAPDLAIPGRGTVAAWLPAVANQAIERL